ncbi:hypothetical protein SprV_0902719700 [Sparganum proliferum]
MTYSRFEETSKSSSSSGLPKTRPLCLRIALALLNILLFTVCGCLCIISFFAYSNTRSVAGSFTGVILRDVPESKASLGSAAQLYEVVQLVMESQRSLLLGVALFSLIMMIVAAVGIVVSACRANCMVLAYCSIVALLLAVTIALLVVLRSSQMDNSVNLLEQLQGDVSISNRTLLLFQKFECCKWKNGEALKMPVPGVCCDLRIEARKTSPVCRKVYGSKCEHNISKELDGLFVVLIALLATAAAFKILIIIITCAACFIGL